MKCDEGWMRLLEALHYVLETAQTVKEQQQLFDNVLWKDVIHHATVQSMRQLDERFMGGQSIESLKKGAVT